MKINELWILKPPPLHPNPFPICNWTTFLCYISAYLIKIMMTNVDNWRYILYLEKKIKNFSDISFLNQNRYNHQKLYSHWTMKISSRSAQLYLTYMYNAWSRDRLNMVDPYNVWLLRKRLTHEKFNIQWICLEWTN